MIRNVLKPDDTVHIEQQVANMRYDLTTGQVETVVHHCTYARTHKDIDTQMNRPRPLTRSRPVLGPKSHP